MAKDAKASAAQTKQTRRSSEHYAKTVSVRLSTEEHRAVEDVRAAMATERGCNVDKISYSEAMRLLLRDKEGAAEIEARAKVIRELPAARLWDDPTISKDIERVSDSLAAVVTQVQKIGTNVNQIARHLNSGGSAEQELIAEALRELNNIAVQVELAEMALYSNHRLAA